jgi:hypothetical protein
MGQLSQNSQGRGRGRGGRGNKPDIDCYDYEKHGHYDRDCWTEKKVKDKGNYTEVKEDDDVLLMAQSMSTSRSNTIWYLDTRASNHMIGHKLLFVEMTELKGSISFRNASKVKGKGKAKFLQRMGDSR